MSLIGVDLGTSGIRAIAYTRDGHELGTQTHRLQLRRPAPGRVELDPTEIRHAVEDAIRQLATGPLRGVEPVEALSFSVQGEAVLPVDQNGNPIGPVVVSMDERGTETAAQLRRMVTDRHFHAITGQPLHPMFSAFKIAAETGPWGAAARYMCLGDYLTLLWTGEAVIDYGMAARTGVLDVETKAWSDELLDAFGKFAPGLSEQKLSRPAPSGTVGGVLTTSASERLGLEAGTVVALGTHDQSAAFLGSGGTAAARSCISLGSSDCFTVGTTTRPQGFDETGFASYPIDDTTWVTLAGTAAGGWALEWFAGLAGNASLDEIFHDLAPQPPALIVLPYLRGSGTLDNDPTATGTIHGLTLETTRPQLARAFVEAAGMEFAKIATAYESGGIDPGQVLVTGSGANNLPALQARANAFGRPLTPAAANSACRGAALLAARSIGAQNQFAASLNESAPTVHPEPGHTAWYASQRETYVALWEAVRNITKNRPATTPTN